MTDEPNSEPPIAADIRWFARWAGGGVLGLA
jgi:hypothetical protein